MDEFKEAHKQYQKSMQDNSQLRELRGDIDIIEMEKENGEYIHRRGAELASKPSSYLLTCDFDSFLNSSIPELMILCAFLSIHSEETDRPHTVTLRQAVEPRVGFRGRSCIANWKGTTQRATVSTGKPNAGHSTSNNGIFHFLFWLFFLGQSDLFAFVLHSTNRLTWDCKMNWKRLVRIQWNYRLSKYCVRWKKRHRYVTEIIVPHWRVKK